MRGRHYVRAGTQGSGWSCSICKVLHGGPRENGRGARVRLETSCSARSRTVGTTDKFLDPPLHASVVTLENTASSRGALVFFFLLVLLCLPAACRSLSRLRSIPGEICCAHARHHSQSGSGAPPSVRDGFVVLGDFRIAAESQCGAADCRGRLRGRRLLLPS